MPQVLVQVQRPAPTVRDVRCECTVCGAHGTGWQHRTLSASCPTCGSYAMRPLDLSLAHGTVG